MKQEIAWKGVALKGMARYEINNIGEVRFAMTRQRIPPTIVGNSERFYTLMYYGREKKFLISELLEHTFGMRSVEEIQDYNSKVKIEPFSAQFSKNEDDYGGRGGGEWEEIKEFLRKTKRINRNGMS